ncbi:GGDEF domain-containing protein [Fervidobacterium sp.]
MEKFEELISLETQNHISNFTMCVVDFINELDEWEFVDKLARSIFIHTKSNGVRVMTKNFIKIIGSTIGMPIRFDSENLRINIYVSTLNKDDMNFIYSVSVSAELHYRNIQKHIEVLNSALYDSLTGVYTRSAVMKLIESAFESVKRTGRKAYLIFFDIDDLKMVNDKYGHLKGDETLQKFALTCLKNIRKTDILVRYGGDEFILFIDSENPNALIERIKNSCEVEFSYGIAQINNEKTLSEVIESVDYLMYSMKVQKKKEKVRLD